jgi:hypothetical protein
MTIKEYLEIHRLFEELRAAQRKPLTNSTKNKD